MLNGFCCDRDVLPEYEDVDLEAAGGKSSYEELQRVRTHEQDRVTPYQELRKV